MDDGIEKRMEGRVYMCTCIVNMVMVVYYILYYCLMIEQMVLSVSVQMDNFKTHFLHILSMHDYKVFLSMFSTHGIHHTYIHVAVKLSYRLWV